MLQRSLALTLATLTMTAASAEALEEVQLSYEGLQFATLSVSDLATFSETGQPSQQLAALLRVIEVDQATARRLLTTDVAVNGQLLADASHTFVGESFFQLLGTTFNLPDPATPGWAYLRDAVVTAAADDQINALEVLQAFEAESVAVETEKIGQVIEKIQTDTATLEAFFDSGFGANE
ncbi:MAG: alpha/beta hydrolase [Leptolyngbya sp. RL_3_1]|nr:alpha/beta hydrolase [Leptolyngbya sp. RL_3_1]